MKGTVTQRGKLSRTDWDKEVPLVAPLLCAMQVPLCVRAASSPVTQPPSQKYVVIVSTIGELTLLHAKTEMTLSAYTCTGVKIKEACTSIIFQTRTPATHPMVPKRKALFVNVSKDKFYF